MRCSNCTALLQEGDRCCKFCGTELAASTTQVTTPSKPSRAPRKKIGISIVLAVIALGVGAMIPFLFASGEHVEYIPAQPGDHPLVGRWEWTENTDWHYIFRADGYASRGTRGGQIDQFRWEIDDDGYVAMTSIDESFAQQRWAFTINCDRLRLDSRTGNPRTYHYNRRR